MKPEINQFIREHIDENPYKLSLQTSNYHSVDYRMAIEQIASRQKLRQKLPEWYADYQLNIPSTTASEQCSSDHTAAYKQSLIESDDVVCDLTGGLGVDAWYFSLKASQVVYIESNPDCCDAAKHNFRTLKAMNINVIHADSTVLLRNNDARLSQSTVFYIDPSRRLEDGRRVYAISDCSPNLPEIISLLPSGYKKLIVKLSPMLDIASVTTALRDVFEVHIICVRNECKELLVVASKLPVYQRSNSVNISKEKSPQNGEIVVHCVNILSHTMKHVFSYISTSLKGVSFDADSIHKMLNITSLDTVKISPEDLASSSDVNKISPEDDKTSSEDASDSINAVSAGLYLYEPNAAIMKAGREAFVRLIERYNLYELHPNSHLFTSSNHIADFPGRIFKIEEVLPYNKKTVKTLSTRLPQANITVRNFPVKADPLHRQLGVRDGGADYIFATTLMDSTKTLLICTKIQVFE